MKLLATVILGGGILRPSGALAQPANFDSLPPGAPPPGGTATQTGTGKGIWTIEQDNTVPSRPNVLKQSGQAIIRFASKTTPMSKRALLK
jgi:hypothetical protein